MENDIIDQEHAGEFFETYGRTMLAWQDVEMNLFFIFNTLIRSPDYNVASAMYRAVTNLNTKLDMITEAVKAAFANNELSSEWVKLRKRIEDRARKRNLLAHYTILGDLSNGGHLTLWLARSVFDIRNKKRVVIGLRELRMYNDLFGEASQMLDTFRKKLPTSWIPQLPY
jgi:hypothetical protein